MRHLIIRGTFLLLCAAAALAPLRIQPDAAVIHTPPRWPSEFEHRLLVQLPLSDVEEQFNAGFPGDIARFNNGERQVILRWVLAGTRKLHSSADCFRGLGYTITPAQPMVDGAGDRWSCFTADRDTIRLRVRERIVESAGTRAWTDVSAWYWSAVTQQSRGPWLATTVIEDRARKVTVAAGD